MACRTIDTLAHVERSSTTSTMFGMGFSRLTSLKYLMKIASLIAEPFQIT